METEVMPPATGSALALVETLTPIQAYAAGAADSLIERIRAEVRATPLDVTTEKGRAKIGSVAKSIGSAKVSLVNMGKALTADIDAQRKLVLTERNRIEAELDALRDEVLAPRKEFEAREAARIEAHQTAIDDIDRLAHDLPYSSGDFAPLLEIAASMHAVRDFQEFGRRAGDVRAAVTGRLLVAQAAARKREAEKAEIDRLAAEAAEHARQEAEAERRRREKAIAEKAADDARIAAELAAREAAEKEAARVEAERVAAERKAEEAAEAIRAAARKAADEAEIARLAQERARLKAEQDAKDAAARAEKAEADRLAAIAKADADKIAAAETANRAAAEAADKAIRDQEAALVAERKRVAAEAAALAAEDAERAKNTAIRKAANVAARDAIVAMGLSEADATKVVTGIARGDVPRVSIKY